MASKTTKPAAQHYHAPLMHIGATRDSIQAMAAAIMQILGAPSVDNSTKVVALQSLTQGCSVSHVSISGCNLSSGAGQAF